ncbi:2641_t:CDS:2 [Acaulospora morrowiae]|uniref:2641_t:CDS:1 n=1 Tax=Acaulospora morrowiae TaxID=94023 RepID=A0A9N9B399_9GLOM|nr:2641_t:CDS:2 [Acaulospora morrowiae]
MLSILRKRKTDKKSASNPTAPVSTIKTKKKARNKKQRQEVSEKHKTIVFAATSNLEKAIQRTKEKVAMIAQEHREQNRKFRDREFDLFVNPMDCLYSLAKTPYNHTGVRRVSKIFKNPQFFIDGVEPNDIKQGSIGDCWFVASLAVITNIPKLIETICVARDEDIGVYGFIFFKDGDWVSTVIDDQLFVNGKDSKDCWKLTFAECSNENETWLPLIEKAYAKIHGDYESISGGYIGQGIEDLTGGVYTAIFISDILDKDRFWNEELKKVNVDVLFACHRYTDNNIDSKGIMSNHSYSILRVAEIENGIKLILIRNPWGKSEWTGAWSDGSKEWTSERMKLLNHRFGDDGAFWMTYEDFLEYWDEIDKCRLFNSSWTVYSTWINYNVVPRSQGKFILTVPEESELVIVLQQPDDRYFSDLPKFEYQLSFRIYEKGNSVYLIRSRLTVPYGPRSINHEVKLPAGTYEIVPRLYREPIIEVEEHTEPDDPANEQISPEMEELKLISKMRKLNRAKGLADGRDLNDDTDDEEEEREVEDEWEISLGLRVYSKNVGLTLEGDPGEFPDREDAKKDDEKKDDADPEVDTRATEDNIGGEKNEDEEYA